MSVMNHDYGDILPPIRAHVEEYIEHFFEPVWGSYSGLTSVTFLTSNGFMS